jgi:hypothetical protein
VAIPPKAKKEWEGTIVRIKDGDYRVTNNAPCKTNKKASLN